MTESDPDDSASSEQFLDDIMSQIVLLTSEELSEENKLSLAAYMRQKFTEIKDFDESHRRTSVGLRHIYEWLKNDSDQQLREFMSQVMVEFVKYYDNLNESIDEFNKWSLLQHTHYIFAIIGLSKNHHGNGRHIRILYGTPHHTTTSRDG